MSIGRPADWPDWLGEPTAAERRLWEAFPYGRTVEYRRGEELRAGVVAALALGAREAVPGRTAGVRISGAKILGELDLRHGAVDVPLTMIECAFTDAVRLEEAETRSLNLTGCRFTTLRATGAHIRGSLELNGASISDGGEDAALLQKLIVDTDLNADGLHCVGRLVLIGAKIGAVLDLNRSKLEHPHQIALNLGGANIGRSMYFHHATVRGHVRMPGVTIGGVLSMSATTLTEPPTTGALANQSLSGETLSTAGDAQFDRKFATAGQVDLSGANFGAKLLFKDARLRSPDDQPALNLNGAAIRRGLYIGDGFKADGVRLTGAQIGGHLDLYKMAEGSGRIVLYHAKVATIRDGKVIDGEVDGGVDHWPAVVLLDGFSYDAFDPYLPASERIRLLRRQPVYAAHPYEFMASYYRELGHDVAAREILIEKERVRHKNDRPASRLWSVISRIAVGYGYLPRRAAYIAFGIQAAATVFYAFATPTAIRPEDHVTYYPVLYTADLFVPIVHFGQTDAFQSHGFAAFVAFILPYLGWALGLAIVAGASRTLSKGGGIV